MSLCVSGINFTSNLQSGSSVDIAAKQKYQRKENYSADSFEKKEKTGKIKKIIAGIAGAAAAIGVGIWGLKKGKASKVSAELKSLEKSLKLDELKFEKGKALLPSGEKFSGTVSHELKNGNQVSMTYRNGQIQSSIIKDKNGKVLTTKEYKFVRRSCDHRNPNADEVLEEVIVNRNGVKSSVEFERSYYGTLEGTKVTRPDKTITFKKSYEIDDLHGNPSHNILTTGLRENMPGKEFRTISGGYSRRYPNADIIDVEDAAGHTITRKFDNGMKDVLKLDKQGTTGTIEHFDKNNELVSKIERTFDRTVENFETFIEREFGGGVHESGKLNKYHKYKDVVKDAKGNIIANKEDYIYDGRTYAW